jgi:hypothetical protein
MRAALIAAALLTAQPAAAACHVFRYWAFPWPQRCPAHAHSAQFVSRQKAAMNYRPSDMEIPLPDVTFVPMDEPDEATRARLLLRAALGQ